MATSQENFEREQRMLRRAEKKEQEEKKRKRQEEKRKLQMAKQEELRKIMAKRTASCQMEINRLSSDLRRSFTAPLPGASLTADSGCAGQADIGSVTGSKLPAPSFLENTLITNKTTGSLGQTEASNKSGSVQQTPSFLRNTSYGSKETDRDKSVDVPIGGTYLQILNNLSHKDRNLPRTGRNGG